MRRANVYRGRGDCTNGGVSGLADTIFVFGESEAIPGDLALTPLHFREENRSKLSGGRRPGEDTYWAARALVPPAPGLVGPMYGGNLAIAQYDGQPERVYHVHDRWETPENYAALSR